MHIIFTFNFSWFLFLNKILFTVAVSQIFGTEYYTNTVFFGCRFIWLNSPKVCNKLNTCESYISDSRCRVPVMPFFDPTSTSLVWLRRIQFITCTIYLLCLLWRMMRHRCFVPLLWLFTITCGQFVVNEIQSQVLTQWERFRWQIP